MPENNQVQENANQPIREFARFFKAYGLGLSLVTAAIPLAMSQWDLVPLFGSIKGPVTNITSVASYLLVGFIFSQRRLIARLYYPEQETSNYLVTSQDQWRKSRLFAVMPGILSVLAVTFFLGYWFVVRKAQIEIIAAHALTASPNPTNAVDAARARLHSEQETVIEADLKAFGLTNRAPVRITFAKNTNGPPTARAVQLEDEATAQVVLSKAPSMSIPHALWMTLLFMFSFLCAVSAFVLMGLKDYLQEVLGRSDKYLILKTVRTTKVLFEVENAPGVRGRMEYCPQARDYPPTFTGPFCAEHDDLLLVEATDLEGKVKSWYHSIETKNGPQKVPCSVNVARTEVELDDMLYLSGRRKFDHLMPEENVQIRKSARMATAAHGIGGESARKE